LKKGGGFEKIVEDWLWSAKCRLVVKTEPPVRVLKFLGKGQFLVVFSSHGVLDFAGPKHGIHIEFDAKDCGADRFSFKMIKPLQVKRMRDLTEDCCITGIILRMRGQTANQDLLYGIPGFVILNAMDVGEKSWSRETLEELEDAGEITKLEYGKPKLILDFFQLAANLKYILPGSFFFRKGASPWVHRRPDFSPD